ncbi:MAG: ATP-binding cassette domain-containing protein [Polyangiales bacterium]
MTTTDVIFELRGVRKRFGARAVLDGVDLTLRRGETVGLLGPSGCGKTVLLKCMIGLISVDEGEILFEGASVAAMDPPALLALRGRVGLMFQHSALFDSMTVAENVAYGLHAAHAHPLDDDEIAARVDWALDAVDLPGTHALRPDELSGGMKRRVGLARTMALRPEVILYDEPTMGLDPVNTHRIGALMKRLHDTHGIAGLMVTHDMKLAEAVTDRAAMILDGRIAGVGTVAELRAHDDLRVRDFIAGTDREGAIV